MANTNQKRFRAKVENFGFRNQHWQAGQIVEVSPEEAEIIPHHFEAITDEEFQRMEADRKIKPLPSDSFQPPTWGLGGLGSGHQIEKPAHPEPWHDVASVESSDEDEMTDSDRERLAKHLSAGQSSLNAANIAKALKTSK